MYFIWNVKHSEFNVMIQQCTLNSLSHIQIVLQNPQLHQPMCSLSHWFYSTMLSGSFGVCEVCSVGMERKYGIKIFSNFGCREEEFSLFL